MSKVNAHYERIYPRNGVRNSVPGVDSIVMCIVKVHSQRIDHRNGVSHSVSGVNPFIMRIYFAHVTGVIDHTYQAKVLQQTRMGFTFRLPEWEASKIFTALKNLTNTIDTRLAEILMFTYTYKGQVNWIGVLWRLQTMADPE